jgi:hypothetical protein
MLFAVAAATLAANPGASTQQLTRSMPESLTDREFWQFFTTMSEEGGSFPSENFVSNEQTYQYVIPTLQHTLTPSGVYLGVGPEQNFTYIANLKPRMAVIFDIRRQNAMAHLMYKAIFELSPTRADFVSRLFSRPLPKSIGASARPAELFAAAAAARMNDSAFAANRRAIIDQLTVKHGFALSAADTQSIHHVYSSFSEAGPGINYGYRSGAFGMIRSTYATYEELQNLTNADGVNMAFLATEESYQWLRALHGKNLVIPVVGDFAGAKAIRAVGEYVQQHGGTVTAFYLSNVEQYLFRQFGDAARFYRNVETLPVDSTSRFIRSVPPTDGFMGAAMSSLGGGPFTVSTNSYSVRVTKNSAGTRLVWTTTTDSTGRAVTVRTVDTSSTRPKSALEIFRSLRAREDRLVRARTDSARRAAGRDSASVGTFAVGRDTMLPWRGAPYSLSEVVGRSSRASR